MPVENKSFFLQFMLTISFIVMVFCITSKLGVMQHFLTEPTGSLFLIFAVALWTDLKSRKIYNNLIVVGLLLGFIAQLYLNSYQGSIIWFLGVLAGFACCMPLYLLRGMAAGDVKLLSVAGGFLGYEMTMMTVLATFIAGGIIGVFYVLKSSKYQQLFENMKQIALPLWMQSQGVNIPQADLGNQSIGKMPYTLAIVAGVLYTLFFYHN